MSYFLKCYYTKPIDHRRDYCFLVLNLHSVVVLNSTNSIALIGAADFVVSSYVLVEISTYYISVIFDANIDYKFV